ncbi:CHAD domain-containing protein [Phormidium tenue FACHB-886]|nr:CHAD domain-containing protein [Phormidium tenue FACHB-886]
MKKEKKQKSAIATVDRTSQEHQSLTLGQYAHQVIEEEYWRVAKQEKDVLEDTDPEHLHQMRVGIRRLRTALQVFEPAVELPKAAGAKRLRDIARVLGEVRDLDVQIATLKDYYQPRLSKSEGSKLETAIEGLINQRVESFKGLQATLTESRYEELKTAYEDWLAHPHYAVSAALPIEAALPDLLTPLLAHLLMHQGWFISSKAASNKNGEKLHDLRKLCKHVRYEAEFFMPFYDKSFQKWVKEIKDLQGQLGEFQDAHVLREILTAVLTDLKELPGLQQAIAQKQGEAMAGWDKLRQKYLDSKFRYQLYEMLLQPTEGAVKP